MDEEKEYWKLQRTLYDNLPYEKNKKYYEWQPARWAGNKVAINIMLRYIKNVKSICEVGAGSCAFSISLFNELKEIEINAIDKSTEAVNYGKNIASDLNIPINYINGNLFEFKGKFDLVLSLGVIEHFSKEDMIRFMKKCIELSNKYILIAIPNQESIVFKSYIKWCEKNNQNYGEDHKEFNNSDLSSLMRNMGLEVLIEDSFQVFLSEYDFFLDNLEDNSDWILILKEKIAKYDKKLADEFPKVNFRMKDILTLKNVELDLSKNIRMKYSFMSFVLAKIKD